MGTVVSRTRDTMGRITAIGARAPGASAAVAVVSAVGYLPFGPVSALTYGNGLTETRTFDLDYRLTGLTVSRSSPRQNLTYGYDAANNVLSIADGVTSANSQSFTYDTLDRLLHPSGSYGPLAYTYDKVGNRLTETPSASGVAPPLDGLGSITGFAYNQAGRLSAAMAGTQTVAQYTYDAFGQRLLKTQPGISTTSHYQFDQSGLLLEESNNQGNPSAADYIYLDDGRAVATLSPGTGALSFLHDDSLGTPQLATGSSQSVVWSANYQPFGQTANLQASIVQDLRLPGQQVESETGFNHNGFRDYVPNLGRYLESDPIGLAGGMNTYAYVGANPGARIDPSGLNCESGFRGVLNKWLGGGETCDELAARDAQEAAEQQKKEDAAKAEQERKAGEAWGLYAARAQARRDAIEYAVDSYQKWSEGLKLPISPDPFARAAIVGTDKAIAELENFGLEATITLSGGLVGNGVARTEGDYWRGVIDKIQKQVLEDVNSLLLRDATVNWLGTAKGTLWECTPASALPHRFPN